MLLILSTNACIYCEVYYTVFNSVLLIILNCEMDSTARSHVEGVVMVFCSTCWLLRVSGEIYRSHGGILAAFWIIALSAKTVNFC